jgi:ketosteroid isomerase-like protein
MASANVELVQSIVAAWRRGDYSATGWAHPEIEFVLADGPDPGRWTGPQGMAEGWRSRLSAWEGLAGHVGDIRAIDDERVLVLFRFSGRGKTSGIDLDQTRAAGAAVFHIRNGKVTRFEHWFDRERALTDLGLAPQGDGP